MFQDTFSYFSYRNLNTIPNSTLSKSELDSFAVEAFISNACSEQALLTNLSNIDRWRDLEVTSLDKN